MRVRHECIGSLLATAALLWPGSPARAQCLAASSSWQNTPFASQTSAFGVSFDATPNAAKMDGVVGLSLGSASGFSSLAAAVRFNNLGFVDARNGSNYSAAFSYPYSAGQKWRFRLAVNPGAHTYTAYVTPPGLNEQLLGSNYAFRTEQAMTSTLSNWALFADVGSHQVCNFVLAGAAPPPPPPPPPPPTGCLNASSAWQNTSLASQSSAFGASFDAIPAQANMDGVTGLSLGSASGFTNLAAAVRFNNTGLIDARNGGSYAASVTVPYTPGAKYHFRLAVDPAAHAYSAYVTPPGAAEIALAPGCAFRAEQALTSTLDNWALFADAGSHQVCAFTLAAAPDTIPPTIGITAPAAGSTLSGTATISGTAADNVGVASVQLSVDGGPYAPCAGTASWSCSLNTTSLSNASHSLAARAKDAAGNAGTATVAISVNNAPTGPGLDRYGIMEIYPSPPGGTLWYNTWDNGIARTFTYSKDPNDPWFDAAHGDATYSVDGKGLFTISGTTPRMYIHDPSFAAEWRNVEMTVYAMRVADDGTAYAGIIGMARANHAAYPPGISDTTNLCDTRGNGGRMRFDGSVDFVKETSHPNAVAAASKAQWPGGLPRNVWLGYKLAVYDVPNGDVKLELYLDTTDGQNGGTWTKINELEDTGSNFGAGGVPCPNVTDPAIRLTNSDARPGSESGKPNATVYFRSTNIGTNGLLYKKMSVRQIAP